MRHVAKKNSLERGTGVSERTLRGLTDLFKGLADRSRLHILFLLAEHGELHVSAIGDELGQSQPAVSHHLNQLKQSGLIEYRRAGKFNYYRLAAGGLDGLANELFPEPGTVPKLAFGQLEIVFKRK